MTACPHHPSLPIAKEGARKKNIKDRGGQGRKDKVDGKSEEEDRKEGRQQGAACYALWLLGKKGSFCEKSSHICTEARAHGWEERNTKNMEVDEKAKTLSNILTPNPFLLNYLLNIPC